VLLDEINNKLEGVINEFRSRLPTADGLVVCPIHAEKVKQAETSESKDCSEILITTTIQETWEEKNEFTVSQQSWKASK